ncbi:MAG: restriction endonuclease subunit S [bacterium]
MLNPRTFSRPPEDEKPISFVPMAAVEAATGRVDVSRVRPYREIAKGYTRFSEGDVLFAKITPCMENGKTAVARGLVSGAGCGSTEFHVLRPLGDVSGELVMYYLLQDDFRKEARRHMAGTAGQQRVPAWFVSEAPFPLPPLAEQRRIVAEIEKYFTRLDAAVTSLQRARANLKRYGASVLKAACEGRLVPIEAELAHRGGRDYEPASVQLDRILMDRLARWKAQERRRGSYREPQQPDTSTLPSLPEGWTWATVEQLCDVGTGSTPLTTKGEYYDGGTIPWVTSGAVNSLHVAATEKWVTEAAVRDCRLRRYPSGTLVLAMYGEGHNRGKISELLFDATINQALAALVFEGLSEHCKGYIKWFLLSRYEETRRASVGGVQPNLNLARVARIPVPLPPVTEQHRVISEVERRLSVIQAAEEMVEANLTRAERLRQAILRRAFEGKLVPQGADDEPASTLLERIRAEREQSGRNASQARRKTSRRRKAQGVSA